MRLSIVVASLLYYSILFAQNVNVCFDEHKVLWRGYENKISLGGDEKLTIEVGENVIVRDLGNNKYTLKPTSNGESATIIVKNKNGETILTEAYPVHPLPKPTIKVKGDYATGYLGRKIKDVIVGDKHFDLDVNYSIISSEIYFRHYGASGEDTIKIAAGENLLESLKALCDTVKIEDIGARIDIHAKVKSSKGYVLNVVEKNLIFKPEILYHPNGRVYLQRSFDNYLNEIGERSFYYENGQLERKEYIAAQGEDASNILCSEDYLTSYYPDGSIQSKGKCLKDGNTEVVSYHANGKKMSEGKMSGYGIQQWEIGKWKFYDEKGNLQCTFILDNDGVEIRRKGDCK